MIMTFKLLSGSVALLATLLRQWARRYIRVTQPRFSSHVRARIHAYFAEGVATVIVSEVSWSVPTCYNTLHTLRYNILYTLGYNTTISTLQRRAGVGNAEACLKQVRHN